MLLTMPKRSGMADIAIASYFSFDYCTRVLQKRWRMTCRHGCLEAVTAASGSGERWHDIGPVDAVKAILISNDPTVDHPQLDKGVTVHGLEPPKK